MRRLSVRERPDWRATAEKHGFPFHTIDGARYWDESACWSFTLDQIERDLEAPAQELEAMCLDLVAEVVKSDVLMRRLRIPVAFWSYVAASWKNRERNLYGRMDLAYDGNLWTGEILERVLDAEVRRGRAGLTALVTDDR